MEKYFNRKTPLWVLAFVIVAQCARRIGQYEALDASRAASRAEITDLKQANDDLHIKQANDDEKVQYQRRQSQLMLAEDEGFSEGIKASKDCRTGNQNKCEYILSRMAGRLDELNILPDGSNYQQVLAGDEAFSEGVKTYKGCRAGNQNKCDYMLSREVGRLDDLNYPLPADSFDYLYDEHGNYKKNAQVLLDHDPRFDDQGILKAVR